MDKKNLELISWVISGSQRTKIIKCLEKCKTPKMISLETNLSFSNVSNCLIDLKKKSLIECINPKSHLGRIYILTKVGEKILSEINKFKT